MKKIDMSVIKHIVNDIQSLIEYDQVLLNAYGECDEVGKNASIRISSNRECLRIINMYVEINERK